MRETNCFGDVTFKIPFYSAYNSISLLSSCEQYNWNILLLKSHGGNPAYQKLNQNSASAQSSFLYNSIMLWSSIKTGTHPYIVLKQGHIA